MLFLCALLLSFVFPLSAVELTVVGSPTYWPILKTWGDAYKLLVPDFNLNFEPSGSGANGIAQMAAPPAGNKSIDIVLCDGSSPNATQYQVGLQVFPFLLTTTVPQLNLGQVVKDIVLNGSVLADIFRGNVTNWADPKIVATNPGKILPNATILVFYRSDVAPVTSLWTSALARWSPEWNSSFGASLLSFPSTLKSKPNFYGYSDVLSLNGAIAGTPYSIGYVQYYIVARDTGLHYGHLFNKWTGKPVPAGGLAAAGDFLKLNSLLQSTFVLDPPDNNSWPIVATVGLLVSTKPSDCNKARELYKFIRWALTAVFPRQSTVQLGCTPLGQNLTKYVLDALNNIKCDGQSIGSYETDNTPTAAQILLFIIAQIVLVLALILSALHIYNYRNSKINLIYTTVFIFGTLLTLISPVFWFLIPDQSFVCQCRIWTMSLGFSIILGTMFSRTWQLQEIYYLQKHGMDGLSKKVSTNKTYVQLAVTLIGVIVINLVILIIWSGADPMSSSFIVQDQVQLTGYWTCRSHNMLPWLVIELIFFLSLLSFGVYVIYDTWSFQRKVVLTETRWVLFALYNVILNICAIAPFLGFASLDDRTLSFIVIASIDLSAGSIACAVLLPRVIENFKMSKQTKTSALSGTGTNDAQLPSSKREGSLQVVKSKDKPRLSRTPEADLAKKLEDPRPLHGTIELQPLSLSPEFHSRSADSNTIQEETGQEPDLDSPSGHPADSPSGDPTPMPFRRDSLQWSENPITQTSSASVFQ